MASIASGAGDIAAATAACEVGGIAKAEAGASATSCPPTTCGAAPADPQLPDSSQSAKHLLHAGVATFSAFVRLCGKENNESVHP